MKKKMILMVSVIIVFGGAAISLSLYQKGSYYRKFKDKINDICYFYQYDKDHPGAHASYGIDYHINRWKQFEQRYGASGTRTIDEFCQHTKKVDAFDVQSSF